MSSSAHFLHSSLVRSLVVRAGFLFTLVSASACANSDKPATPIPDKPVAVVPEAKPEVNAAEEKAAADKAAEEKATADKAAAEKAEAEKAAQEKALVKDVDPKLAESAKAAVKGKEAPAAQPQKSADKATSGSAKGTKLESKTGILAKGEADKYVKKGGRAVVHLLESGAEPRTVASYALTKGAAKPLAMVMDLEMAMSAGDMQMPATKMPRMILTFDFSTGDRSGSEWPIDGKLSKLDVESNGGPQDQIAAALRPQLGQIAGLGMNYFVDEKGRIRDVKVTLPPSLPPMAGQMMSGMTQSVESMTSPLPDEPVGDGAKWEVLSRIVANGADLLQITTFTLEKRDGNVLSLDAVVKQFAAKDSVNPPGMPPGASARISSYKCAGGGKPVFDLTDVAPKSGSMSIHSSMTLELKMDVDGKAEKQSTSVDTTMTATYKRP